MDPALVLFAIEAAVRLGRKLNDVLVDETQERAFVLPLGSLLDDIAVGSAGEYFDNHPELVDPGGPYAGLSKTELIQAYKTIVTINRQLGGSDRDLEAARQIVAGLHGFTQLNEGFGAKPALQRILGTIVEIGIDWFATHPESIGKDSNARKIVQGFVLRLDEVDFAEGTPGEIVGNVLVAALHTLDENVTLIDDDARLHALLGGVTKAVLAEVESGKDAASLTSRGDLARRIGSAILRGGATAFVEHSDLFLRGDGEVTTLVQSTLGQVLEGVRDQPDLFTNESLERIFQSALVAVGQNAPELVGKPILRDLIKNTVDVLQRQSGAGALFSEATVAAVVEQALGVAGDHMEELVDPDGPREMLFSRALASVAHGMSAKLAGSKALRSLLGQKQATELAGLVFAEVAERPDALLQGVAGDDRGTALAQIVGSVASALGEHPEHLVSGRGLVELARVALRVGARNVDGLVDLEHADPRTNLLARTMGELAAGIADAKDPRGLLARDSLVELARRVLPIVSANAGMLRDGDPLVRQSVDAALAVANGALAGRTDAATIPNLIAGLLVEAVWQRIDLGDRAAVEHAAVQILQAA